MNHPSAYREKDVVVLGLARSGQAVAKVFHQMGARVLVNDLKPREECPEADALEALGICVVCGSHPDDLIHDGVALLVKNPGIPYKAPPVARALEKGVEVVTEVEVAYHLSKAPIIGITGSNGKTTTTTWIGEMLQRAELHPVVAGNIGKPLSEVSLDLEAEQWLVAELSSFQLKGTVDFRPRIGLLLNVSETHLDYHGSMEDYVESKLKLFANQQENDWAVLNMDDAICRDIADQVKGKLLAFSTKETLKHGVFLLPTDPGSGAEEETLVFRDKQGQTISLCPVREIGIPGRHNLENGAAAAAVALTAGAHTDAIGAALREFRGVEHRLELVRSLDGAHWYNNSKATNAVATVKALESFEGNVILIAGGLDRGAEYDELKVLFGQKLKALVVLGETRDKMKRVAEQAGVLHIKVIEHGRGHAKEAMDEAVQAAYALAEAGDVILLSPACASWDMFSSYEQRGSMFKNAVHNL